jgi:protein-S-isoprenylcysteine O-methyltransferase Ste14
MYWQWRPLTGSVWSVANTTVSYVIWAIFFLGWGIVLISTFLISHFDLFGLRQVWLYLKNKEYTEPGFTVNFLYNFVRHPIMLGFIIAFWATPNMTVGHLLFALMTTAYILVAIQIEERDIARVHGQPYNDYRRRVSMIVPMPKRPAEPESQKTASV